MQQSLARLAAVGALALAAPLAHAQPAAPSCTATGGAAVPSTVVPGLADGPHTLLVGGVRLWYCVAGAGAPGVAPVVFLHGGPGQGSYHFAALAGPALEPRLRMVYLDQRGSGRSERPWTRAYSIPILVDDIEALRQALGVPRLSLVAHSFAGALALEYAVKYPEHVARIVMVDAISDLPASFRGQCERLATIDPAAYARSGPDGKPPADAAHCDVFAALGGGLGEFFHANMFPDSTVSARLDSVDAASGMHNTGEMSGKLFGEDGLSQWRFTAVDRVNAPVLVVAGAKDFQVGLGPQRALAEALPNARLLVYERSGHFPYLDEPARFARDVVAFLAQP